LHGDVRGGRDSPRKKYFQACQLRENLAAENDAMTRTTLRKIYEVVHFRDQHVRAHGVGTGTAAAIAAAYVVVKTAKGREPVSATFVGTSLTVHKRLLSHCAIANILLAMDDKPRGTNPSDNAQVLQNIASKGKTTYGIERVMQGIAHVHRSGVPAQSGMFSSRGIAGTKATGKRGLADPLLFKKECLGFVLGRLPFKLGFSEGSWFSLARVRLANYDSHDAAPAKWTCVCTGPQLLYLEFCENLVYGTTFVRFLSEVACQTIPRMSAASQNRPA
jgi:hypothetical protein